MMRGRMNSTAFHFKPIDLSNPVENAGETISADYITEYSTDRIEMHLGAVKAGDNVVLIDDLIATGGTLCKSAAELARMSMLACFSAI
jgi:adenine/guanine phosphoribosyltransferase-like PRPP-binding protein